MKIVKKIFLAFLLVLVIATPLTGMSYSQTATPISNADFDQIKASVVAGFNQKITELSQLPAQIDANPQLTAEQKTQLKEKVQQNIQLLTDLLTKVEAAQTQEALLKVMQDFMQQAQNPANNEQLNTIQGIQGLIDNLKQQGVDVTDMQAALDALKQQVQQGQVQPGQNPANQPALDFSKVKNLGQAIQILKKQYKKKPTPGQSNAANARQWTNILHQAQQLKRDNPKLFPTYLPSLNPTQILPTATTAIPSSTIGPTVATTNVPTTIPTVTTAPTP
jgi:hypothetical protein